jgi:crossover junction endodeoxyribonuclease RuvC
MTIIIGVDPGSRTTGFGVIQLIKKKITYVDSGYISVADKAWDQRLQEIFQGICTIMKTYQPEEAAIEQVFMHQNPGAALKLGQARGAALVAMTSHGVSVDEYSARQVKQSVVGYGAAKKDQVQHMICTLLELNKAPQADAADALAIAICHANTSESLLGVTGVRGVKEGRWR